MTDERRMADAAKIRHTVMPRGSFAGFNPVTFTNPTVELLTWYEHSRPPAWMHEGRCYDTGNPDAWFPGPGQHNTDAQAAVAICRTCPVITECLTYATDRRLDGVWGGTTETSRREVRNQRGATA